MSQLLRKEWLLWVLVWILVGTAVFCLIAAPFAPKARPVQPQEA